MIAVTTVIGRIGSLEQKISHNGSVYVEFTLCNNRGYGEHKAADWYSCVAFDNVAQRLLKSKATKGTLLQVVGSQTIETFVKTDGRQGLSVKLTLYDWSYVNAGKQEDSQADKGTAQEP